MMATTTNNSARVKPFEVLLEFFFIFFLLYNFVNIFDITI